jgi:hypothetical protein
MLQYEGRLPAIDNAEKGDSIRLRISVEEAVQGKPIVS